MTAGYCMGQLAPVLACSSIIDWKAMSGISGLDVVFELIMTSNRHADV